jgi:hypothetical protein
MVSAIDRIDEDESKLRSTTWIHSGIMLRRWHFRYQQGKKSKPSPIPVPNTALTLCQLLFGHLFRDLLVSPLSYGTSNESPISNDFVILSQGKKPVCSFKNPSFIKLSALITVTYFDRLQSLIFRMGCAKKMSVG